MPQSRTAVQLKSMCPADLSTGKIPHGHTTPLDGMNTYILTGRWAKQAPQDTLRPLRLTKTTDSAPKRWAGTRRSPPKTPSYAPFDAADCRFWRNNMGSRRKFDVQRIKKSCTDYR